MRAEHRVVLGTGEAEFEPIDGEPRLRLVAGAQGGFHVWASFLAYGFSSSQVDLLLQTRVEDDPAQSLVMHAHLLLRDTVDASGEPARSFAGFPAQIYDARCALDKRVSVHLTLADADGETADDVRYCIADVAAEQQRADCDGVDQPARAPGARGSPVRPGADDIRQDFREDGACFRSAWWRVISMEHCCARVGPFPITPAPCCSGPRPPG
jgi:hypothetical protein